MSHPSNPWTHAICQVCWYLKRGDQTPAHLADAREDACCYCGVKTKSGIYVRDNPMEVHK